MREASKNYIQVLSLVPCLPCSMSALNSNYLYYSLLDRLSGGWNEIPDELYGTTKLLVKDYFSLLYVDFKTILKFP